MLHVMLDLYGCPPDLLADEAFLRQVLDKYPTRIAMEKVSPVELRYIETSNPLDAGYSGFVIIATSHVSLHAWPPYGMVNIDIFSCEYFDTDDVVAFAKAMFQTDDVEVNVVKRATRSPRVLMRQENPVTAAPIPLQGTHKWHLYHIRRWHRPVYSRDATCEYPGVG